MACALALGFPSAAHAEAAPSALPRGAMPFRPPGGQPPRTAATFGPAAATPTTNLDYYGGPVVSAPQVVQVVYGTGSFLPEVTGTIAPSVDAFLQNLVGSGYLTELAEFDTVGITSVNGRAGTGQHVVAGTYLGQRTITPAPARNGVVIYDADLQAELEAQIEAPSSALPLRPRTRPAPPVRSTRCSSATGSASARTTAARVRC